MTCYNCEKKKYFNNECKQQINKISKIKKFKQFNVLIRKTSKCGHCRLYETHKIRCIIKNDNYQNKIDGMITQQNQQIRKTVEHKKMT